MQTPWENRYAQRTQHMKGSVIRDLLKFTENPDVISFAGGLPAPDVFPVEEFKQACAHILDHYGAQALQYGSTDGYPPLREMICRYTNRLGIGIDTSNILITSGSQQALDLLGKIFINRRLDVRMDRPPIVEGFRGPFAFKVVICMHSPTVRRGTPMPMLTVRNLPDDVHRALKEIPATAAESEGPARNTAETARGLFDRLRKR